MFYPRVTVDKVASSGVSLGELHLAAALKATKDTFSRKVEQNSSFADVWGKSIEAT